MKKVTILFVGLNFLTTAQISVYENNNTVRNITTSELNSTTPIDGNNIEIGNTAGVNFTSNIDKSIVACTEVRVKPNTNLKAPLTSSNELHIDIIANKLEIFSHSHTNLTQIHALEKFETSIELPLEIAQKIELYKQNDLDVNGLNPFLEWEIYLKVKYTHLSTGNSHFNYGFYYEDYVRNMNGVEEHWGWDMVPNTEGFRVRYAFPELNGIWKLEYELYVNNNLYYSYCPFMVTVIDKQLGDGFVRVAANKRVLERNNDLFLPIGHNLKWPYIYQKSNGDTVACEYDLTPCESAAFYAFDQQMQDFSDSGIDYFRILLSPGSIDFEFEKMGNYFDRLNYAKEIDKIIEFAENEDMYVDFNMKLHYSLVDGPSYSLFAWDGSDYTAHGFDEAQGLQQYCYIEELNMNSPIEFFTNTEAKKFYKQKLRYLLSRWGYSTHIAMFELVSEINLVGEVVEICYNYPNGIAPSDTNTWNNYGYACTDLNQRPYINNYPSHRLNTYLWQKEMAEYIKHTLQHKQHILTCSYAGEPLPGDATFSIPELDIIGLNKYSFGSLNSTVDMQNYVNWAHQYYNKPVIFSESGPLTEMYCSGTYSYTQQLWQLAFTGVAGFNYWDAETVESAPEWAEMKKLKDWILNDPLKKSILLGDWKTGHSNGTVRGNPETYWRKDFNYIYETATYTSDFKNAFGALLNLTDNYYTNNEVDSSWCINTWDNENKWMKDRINFDIGLSANNQIFVKNDLSTNNDPLYMPWGYFEYDSELVWYDLATFNSIPGNWTNYYSAPLSHPILYVTDNNVSTYGKRSILPFEGQFREISEQGMTQTNGNEVPEAYAALAQNNRLEIFKVPISAIGQRRNTMQEQHNTIYEIYITNVMGQKIYEGTIDLRAQSGIFTETFPTGMLIITLINNNEKHTLRWLNL